MSDWETTKAFAFFFGEFEYVREDVYGGGGLFEEELHRGVADDGAAHFGGHKIFDILGDGGESEIIFTSTFGEREEKVGGIFVLHELPCLIDDEEATFLFGANDVPDVREYDVHSYGAELVFEIANVEDDHRVVDVDVGLLRKDSRESAGGVFAEALGELGA